MLHPIERLFAAMSSVAPFPDGVVPLPARLSRTAFFPGGAGLWGAQRGQPLPAMPHEGVMVLGHDFHSEDALAKSVADDAEVQALPSDPACRRSPTWTNLLRFLRDAEVAPERCFFTNAFMGLRKGAETTGQFPGSRDPQFVARCQEFFLLQMHAQQPRVVLALGKWVPSFLAPLSNRLSGWSGARSLIAIDEIGAMQHDVSFGEGLASCSVVALTHPSLRGPNVSRRTYRGSRGHPAELRMVAEAIAKSGATVRVA